MNGSELKAELVRANITYRAVATELGISEMAFYNKLNGKTEFKNSEIIKIAQMLGLSMDEVNAIFFKDAVN